MQRRQRKNDWKMSPPQQSHTTWMDSPLCRMRSWLPKSGSNSSASILLNSGTRRLSNSVSSLTSSAGDDSMRLVHAFKASQTFKRTRWTSARQTLQVVSLYRPRSWMTCRRYINSSISRESSKLSIDIRDQLVLMFNPPWLITCGNFG